MISINVIAGDQNYFDAGQSNLDKEVTKNEDEFLGTVNVKRLYFKNQNSREILPNSFFE